jgi:hypothetical protein
LLAVAGTVSEAEAAMEKGIDVARRQNAESWELRGAMSSPACADSSAGSERRLRCSRQSTAGLPKGSIPNCSALSGARNDRLGRN